MKKGDRVQVLDEATEGLVSRIDGDLVWVDVGDFELSYPANQLVVVADQQLPSISRSSIVESIKSKDIQKKKKSVSLRGKERYAPKMEVDLHLEKLGLTPDTLHPADALEKQLDAARGQLEFAIRKGIQKVVFIHGVGQGVLKRELTYLFGRYSNVDYYPADYKKYGAGATEIFIRQQP